MKLGIASLLLASLLSLTSCQGGLGGRSVMGNEGGSEPVNEIEAAEMQQAVNRCHRSGGTRVVKIRGQLRCY